jgi:hypothetical protein
MTTTAIRQSMRCKIRGIAVPLIDLNAIAAWI